MKALLLLAKAAIAFVWFILIFNIFAPFPGNAAIVSVHHGRLSVHYARLANGNFHRCIW
nr:DUF1145 domain-containing protein [Vibrio cidicii]